MKLTKGKKAAMICFAVFLAFMAVCTVVAKGIYASGLPRVTTTKPYSGSLSHVIKVDGTVMQGQEYGVYVESGLRVDSLYVNNGDAFQTGDPLFRIDVEDLADILAERRLETAKLEVQMAEAVKESSRDRQARQQAVQRAREDYDREAVLADAQIQECRQAYDAAQRALALYDQYLENSSKPVDSEAVPSQPADAGTASSQPTDNGMGAQPTDNEIGASKPADSGTASSQPTDNETGASKPVDSGTASSQPANNGAASSQPTDNETGASKPTDSGAEASQPMDNGTDNGNLPAEDGTETEKGPEEEENGNTGSSDVPGEGETQEHPEEDAENGEVEPNADSVELGTDEKEPSTGMAEAGMDEKEPSADLAESVTSGVGDEVVDSGIVMKANTDTSGTAEQKIGNTSRYSRDKGDIGDSKNGGENIEEPGKSELHKVGSVVVDPEDQYNKEERRRQLEQNVIAAAQALEEAERQKEDRLQNAARTLEDAEAAIEASNSAVNTMALDIAYQKESMQRMEELLEADGWVYAESSGRVIENRLEVGERTQDRAGILYALDDRERVINAVFSEEQGKHFSVGTQFEMKASMPDGSRVTAEALVDYMEKEADGMIHARLSFDLPQIFIGQSVELTYRMQTENYTTCIPVNCIYQDGGNNYYVYTAEEQQGILGTEWRIRKVTVTIQDQNDTMAAILSGEITGETRIVSSTDKPLADGDVIRVL